MKTRAGFTLIEMVMALSLSAVALVGVMTLFLPIVSSQAEGYRRVATQSDAFLAHKSLNQSISQASEVYSPAPGSEGDVLSGCSNFDSAKGGPIDAASLNASFYYCVAGGVFYSYAAAPGACPPPEPRRCGEGSPTVLANGVSHAAGHGAYFVRPAGNLDLIEVHFQTSSKGVTQPVNTAMAYQGSRWR